MRFVAFQTERDLVQRLVVFFTERYSGTISTTVGLWDDVMVFRMLYTTVFDKERPANPTMRQCYGLRMFGGRAHDLIAVESRGYDHILVIGAARLLIEVLRNDRLFYQRDFVLVGHKSIAQAVQD